MTQAPGWYPDPWRVASWRWWDGIVWTPHVAGPPPGTGVASRPPRLPNWLSGWVIGFGIVSMLLVVVTAILAPLSIPLGLIPFAIVLPTLNWLDRVEPEPRASRVHAVLWGATVSAVVAIVINTIVAFVLGDILAAVVSAPVVEEATKGLGVLWAVRRNDVDGVMDGIVYAGWVALGFALVENFSYFANAGAEGSLLAVFVLRGLFTPFAHPLFTAWTGLAIGLAVSRGRNPWTWSLWGLALAIGSHAAWNGSLTAADTEAGVLIVLVAMAGFVILFITAATMVVLARQMERRQFTERVPFLAARYGLSPAEVGQFLAWSTLLRTRRALPRRARRSFDEMHRALARLACLHTRATAPTAAEEAVLIEQLQHARRGSVRP